jgi:glycosyltransferase involved in cell wall biosynthesis
LGLENIEFREPISKSDIPKVQADADILLAAVTDSEAYRFGLNLNKMFDYFASSRPVLFSGSAPNDPVKAAAAGYSVPPESPKKIADALCQFALLSSQERSEMGRRGRIFVEQFDIEKIATNMEELLKEAVMEREGSYAIGRKKAQGN